MTPIAAIDASSGEKGIRAMYKNQPAHVPLRQTHIFQVHKRRVGCYDHVYFGSTECLTGLRSSDVRLLDRG